MAAKKLMAQRELLCYIPPKIKNMAFNTVTVNNTIVSFESFNNFDEDKIEYYIVCSHILSPVLIIIKYLFHNKIRFH